MISKRTALNRLGIWIAALAALFLVGSLSAISAKDANNTAAEAAAGKIDINTADAETLSTLKGIGPKTAMRIITYRKEMGNFKAVEDLMEVKGIGEKSFETLKPFITVK